MQLELPHFLCLDPEGLVRLEIWLCISVLPTALQFGKGTFIIVQQDPVYPFI